MKERTKEGREEREVGGRVYRPKDMTAGREETGPKRRRERQQDRGGEKEPERERARERESRNRRVDWSGKKHNRTDGNKTKQNVKA
jgi:hypothetical protein